METPNGNIDSELVYLHLHLHLHVILASSVLRSVHSRGARPLFSLSLAPPHARLSLISRHLENRPPLPLNTPFSSERSAEPFDDVEYNPIRRSPITPVKIGDDVKMSQQPEHPTLLIPGPIEFDDAVLQSMGHFRYLLLSSMDDLANDMLQPVPCWSTVRRHVWGDSFAAPKTLSND